MYSADLGVAAFRIRARLVVWVVLAMMPHLVLLSLQGADLLQSHMERERQANQAHAIATANAFLRYLESLWAAEVVLGSAILQLQHNADPEEIGRFLARHVPDHPAVVRFSWLNPEGAVVACTDGATCGVNLAPQGFVAEILQGSEKSLSPLIHSVVDGSPVVAVARGIRDGESLQGILVATLDVTRLGEVLPDGSAAGRGCGLVDSAGKVVYQQAGPSPHFPAGEGLTGTWAGASGGGDSVVATEPVAHLGWVAFATTPLERVRAESYGHVIKYAGVVLLAYGIAVAVLLWFGQRLLRPVMALEQAARAIFRGDLSARVGVQGTDEIAVAARAFDQMAERIQQSESELRARALQQEAVARLGLAALEGANLQQLLDQTVNLLREVLQVEICNILELSPGGDKLLLRAGCGWPDGAVGSLTVPTSLESQAGYTLISCQPVIVTDLSQEIRFRAPHLQALGVVSGMSVIIQGEHRPYGVMGVYTTRPRVFTHDDLSFLQLVANVVAAAMERAEAQRLHGVQFGAARALAEANGLTAGLTKALQVVCEGLGWEMGVVWLPDARGDVLRCQALWRQPSFDAPCFEAATRSATLPLGQGFPGEVLAAGGQPRWVTPRDEPDLPRGQEAVRDGVETLCAFPVIADEVVGILELASASVREPDPTTVDLMRLVGGLVAQFVKRKRAEEELRRVNTELEERVADRTTNLTLAIRELEAFSYSVSHDLQGPLRSIEGFARALLEDGADRLTPEDQDSLRRIEAAAHKMRQLIKDLLRLSQLARKEIRREEVDLTALAWAAIGELQRLHPNRAETVLRVREGMRAYADSGLVYLALFNLLENAWKFTSRHPEPMIEVGQIDAGDETIFFVRDNGIGFDMAQAQNIFLPFKRLHPAGAYPGSGIGLATVQRIVQRHGGRIWAESRPGEGAVFFFTLGPRRGAT
ncbi:MAG TPA: GAF domain-containing protein [Symbiobacteriaceae bacterium]